MLKESWAFSSVSVVLVDGTLIEGASAVLYLDSMDKPVILQVTIDPLNKQSIPFAQIKQIGHK